MSTAAALESLVSDALAGQRSALARLISTAERGGDAIAALEAALLPHRGDAWCIGLTGAPGAGKSSLASALTAHLREHDERVALLAVDPSSPLSHGALLGDRVRMQPHLADREVFIRSMAARGHLGGLAMATRTARRVLAACGWPLVLIETVGVGQSELEVAGATDTVVVVLNPGWGDEMQASKAGLMEVADIFVINKADRDGVEATRRDLEGAIATLPPAQRPAVVTTVATENEGIAGLWQAIVDHRESQCATGAADARRRAQVAGELQALARARLADRLDALLAGADGAALATAVAAGDLDIDSAARSLVATLISHADGGGQS